MSDDSKKRKRNRVGTNKRWTGEEELLILNYLLDLAPRNQEFEKPSKGVFYKAMTENLRLAVAHPNHTMNKVKNMRTLYVKAVDWKANTGQGVESGTIDDYVTRMCPHFDTLEEIFGHKSNVVPPYVYESGLTMDQQSESTEVAESVEAGTGGEDTGATTDVDDDTSAINSNDYLVIDISDNYECLDEYLDAVDGGDFGESDAVLESNEMLAPAVPTSTPTSEKSKFKTLLSVAPSKSITKSSTKPQTSDKENVSRFKKRLMKSPVSPDKTISRNSTSILADAHNKKAEAILLRNEIEKTRAENEKQYKFDQFSLEKEKFQFEKEQRRSDLEVRKMDIELREKEIQSRERIEMYRIEMEAKNNLEIAKLRNK